ncbi:MAG: metallophosphoesterase [Chloroflexi bacterium]|nr:metallophosphoesterase [Chloroflexota bacterium]
MKRRDFIKSVAAMAASYPFLRRFNPLLAQASTQQFFIPPTTLDVTENEATIYFRLSKVTDLAEVIVRKNGTEIQRLPIDAMTQLRQLVTIKGLESASTYEAEVLVDGQTPGLLGFEEAWGPITFRTQPYEWPIRFAALGDSGFGDGVTQQLADHIAQEEINFFIHLGDMVYFSYEYDNDLWLNWMLKYYGPFKDTLRRVPHFMAVGNHDREETTLLDGQSFIYWAFPPVHPDEAFEGRRQWSSFVANDVQFLALDSQVLYTDPGRAEQNQWLDERLADPSFRTTIPFFHIPLWTSSSVHRDDGLPVSGDWYNRFSNAANRIGVVIAAHAHLYERLLLDNVHYITSGGGSQSIYQLGEALAWSQKALSLAHYILVEVYKDKIVVVARDVNNSEIDTAEWSIL